MKIKNYKVLKKFTKKDIQSDDLIFFKNGIQVFMDEHHMWIIEQCYDNELNCLTNDDFTIIQIYRPEYELVYDKNKTKQKTNLNGHTQSKK